MPVLLTFGPFAFGREDGYLDVVVLDTDGKFDYPGSFETFGVFGKFGSFDVAGVGSVGFGATGFGATGFGATGFGATGFGATGFGATGFGTTGFGATGFGATGFGTGIFTGGILGGTFGTLAIIFILIIIAKAAAKNYVSVWARTRLELDSSAPYSMSSNSSSC